MNNVVMTHNNKEIEALAYYLKNYFKSYFDFIIGTTPPIVVVASLSIIQKAEEDFVIKDMVSKYDISFVDYNTFNTSNNNQLDTSCRFVFMIDFGFVAEKYQSLSYLNHSEIRTVIKWLINQWNSKIDIIQPISLSPFNSTNSPNFEFKNLFIDEQGVKTYD